MSLKSLLLASLISTTSLIGHASTDWTPILNTLQDSCVSPPTNAKGAIVIPATYQSSIVSNKFSGDSDGHKQVIILKNATAFGAPLAKISIDRQMAGSETKLIFGNNNFMSKIHEFYYQDYDKSHKIIAGQTKHTIKTKDDAEYTTEPTGYSYHDSSSDLSLIFNPKQHAIVCGGGND